jgi:peptidoglycan/LPS O-acetylase OafA/YrhL
MYRKDVAQDRHNFGLDLVRAAAILLVLFSHTADWWLGPGRKTEIQAAYIGGMGVEIFFSLSGFLIGGILLRTQPRSPGELARFWTRRWLRTLPAYWALLIGLNLYFGTNDWRSFIFLQSWVPRTMWTPLLPQTWSLVLEEWFYLFVPPLLAVIGWCLGSARRRWAVPIGCALLIAACFAGRAVVGLQPGPIWGPEPNDNPILRLDCAAWGVLAAWIVSRRRVPGVVAVALVAAAAGTLLLCGEIWVRLFEPERLISWGVHFWGPVWQPLQPSLLEAASAMLVVGLHRLLPGGHGILAWLPRMTARLSYALYLVHVPALYLVYGGAPSEATTWIARFGLTVAVIIAAVLMHVGIELPLLALRDRWMPERRTAHAAGNRIQPALI